VPRVIEQIGFTANAFVAVYRSLIVSAPHSARQIGMLAVDGRVYDGYENMLSLDAAPPERLGADSLNIPWSFLSFVAVFFGFRRFRGRQELEGFLIWPVRSVQENDIRASSDDVDFLPRESDTDDIIDPEAADGRRRSP
jgi:hypothetical protein